jgi:prepilin-type N-terminal cleavage/methylation domain-containing protein
MRIRTTQANRAGLTLIEIMVALGIGSIIFLATALIMVPVQRSWDRTMHLADVQRDASVAMLAMKRSIRIATRAELDNDGFGVKIYRNTGWIRFWYEPQQKNLRYQFEGQDEQMLLHGIVENMTFGVANGSVTVNIVLNKDSCTARLATTTTMRNYKS